MTWALLPKLELFRCFFLKRTHLGPEAKCALKHRLVDF